MARPFPSGEELLQVTMLRESFTEEGHSNKQGLKDGKNKNKTEGIGGRKSGGKKGMEVRILLQRGG